MHVIRILLIFLFLLLRIILILMGWIIVPIAVLFKAYEVRESKAYANRMVRAFKWKIIWIFSNEEEGIGHYGNPEWSLWRKIIYSECVRNPANNLRYVPILSLKIEPAEVKYYAWPKYDDLKAYDDDKKNFFYFAWHGLYSCIRFHWSFFGLRGRTWAGWKIYPEDTYGLPTWSHRNVSAGFATQIFRRLN